MVPTTEKNEINLKLTDLINIDEIQKLQDAFSQATGVASIIVDPIGRPITKHSNFCKLCKIIRKTEIGYKNCTASFNAIIEQKEDGPKMQLCHKTSLWDGSASIKIGNKLIANWMIGHVRNESINSQEQLLKYADEIGADRQQVLEAINETTVMPQKQFESVCQHLFLMANQLSNFAYQNMQKSKSIEELKLAKENLKNSRLYIRNIIDKIEDPIFVKDENYKWVLINDTYCKILGQTREQLLGKNEYDILPSKRADDFQLQDHMVFSSNETKTFEETLTLNNKTRTISTKKSPFTDPISGKKLLVGISRDVTEERVAAEERDKMQKQIFQSSKLASIGELAAGIGHEINNPLFVISGSLEILEQQLQSLGIDDDICNKVIHHQKRSIKRISDIVNGLRTYARSDCDIIENVHLNKNIEKILSFVEVIYDKAGVFIRKDFCNEEMAFTGNIGKFQQVLMNLLSNAKDATEGKSQREIIIQTTKENNRAILKIIDNGSGINQNDLPKIFDSFFTTKDVGKGTGLGLGIVKNIVENINGTINVSTEVGVGTTFTVSLPLKMKAEISAQPHQQQVYQKLSGRALVVDDENFIREILKGFLGKFGLEVDAANDGQEALDKIYKQKYDYIITDLTMPIMSGQELIHRLHDIPGFNSKIIVMTGKIHNDLEKLPVDGFIGKPFQSKEIYTQLIS